MRDDPREADASPARAGRSMPLAAFGGFLAGIPAPLGIGTTLLADGTTPKGFIVEPEGLHGAADITAFGGWRAYAAVRLAPPTPTGAHA